MEVINKEKERGLVLDVDIYSTGTWGALIITPLNPK